MEQDKVSIRVRRLEARDKPHWLELFKGYIAFYKASLPDEVMELTWQRLIAGDPDFHVCLVATDAADVPVGIAHALFHRSTWSPTWYCYLEDLFVAPAVRTKGIGRALIEAVYKEADARPCTRTYWVTQEFNYRARALYDQLATKSPFVQYRR
ncbi:MAG: GNAT family N-acetyltransferase [Hyphomicrobiaceae bacterium]|nr:GNAT family N-acetyltransferase [Hyphomicrobiaceae bacterium]